MTAFIGMGMHYTSYGTPGGEYGKECRAAIVTEILKPYVSDDEHEVVSLAVLNPTGVFFNQEVKYDRDRAGGTWHYSH